MKAIDWIKWLTDPFKKHEFSPVKNDDYIWQDSVTGTIFRISIDEYQIYLNIIKKELKALSADECFKVLGMNKIPFGKSSELEIATQIPYPRPLTIEEWNHHEQKIRTRLVDHVVLRTGLYFAIERPSKEEWQILRKRLLQVDYEPRTAIEDNIEKFIITGKWSGEPHSIDLVKAGSVKIKQYLMETNNIQEIRGASNLLDDINRYRIINLVSTYWTPEALIYNGGGNILIMLPQNEGKRCSTEIENLFNKVTVTAQAISMHITVSMDQLNADKFSKTLGWLELKKMERQMTKLIEPVPDKPDINLYCTEKIEPETVVKELAESQIDIESIQHTEMGIPLCQLCKKREKFKAIMYRAEPHIVCSSCYHKIIGGRNNYIMLEETGEIFQRWNININVRRLADTLSDIADEDTHYISVLYGDGNNMGYVVGRISSFQKYRYFSHLVDSVTKFATYPTLVEMMKEDILDKQEKSRFEIIAAAGDDLLFIVPGQHGLEIARIIGKKFDQALSSYVNGEIKETITISIGVCIADYKVPFASIFRTAQELLKNAKEYKRQNDDLQGGTVDFMKVRASTPYAGGLKQYRKEYFQKNGTRILHQDVLIRYLMRPYTWSQLEKVEEWISRLKSIQGSRALLYQLREVVEKLTINEAKLFYLYQVISKSMGKGSTAKNRRAFHDLLKEMGSDESPLTNRRKLEDLFFFERTEKNRFTGIMYSPWRDLLELWDVKGGRSWQENGK